MRDLKYFVKFDRDSMTNIVVVQFVSDIQTNMDIKYNLTCVTRGPGEAIVTSGLIGAGYRSLAYFIFSQDRCGTCFFANIALRRA